VKRVGLDVQEAFPERELPDRAEAQVLRAGAGGRVLPIPAAKVGLEPGELWAGAAGGGEVVADRRPVGIAVGVDVAKGDVVRDPLEAEEVHQPGVDPVGVTRGEGRDEPVLGHPPPEPPQVVRAARQAGNGQEHGRGLVNRPGHGQYSSASMIVRTRWVTLGSAGSGEPISLSRS
jgi:hypothetical protein